MPSSSLNTEGGSPKVVDEIWSANLVTALLPVGIQEDGKGPNSS